MKRCLSALCQKDEILEVDISELIVDMETEIEHSCGFESMDAEMKKTA